VDSHRPRIDGESGGVHTLVDNQLCGGRASNSKISSVLVRDLACLLVVDVKPRRFSRGPDSLSLMRHQSRLWSCSCACTSMILSRPLAFLIFMSASNASQQQGRQADDATSKEATTKSRECKAWGGIFRVFRHSTLPFSYSPTFPSYAQVSCSKALRRKCPVADTGYPAHLPASGMESESPLDMGEW
jgi:hypothetical protein